MRRLLERFKKRDPKQASLQEYLLTQKVRLLDKRCLFTKTQESSIKDVRS